VSLILEAVTPDTKIIGIGASIAVIVAIVLLFFPKLRQMLKPRKASAYWAALPWLLTGVLAVILVFIIIPQRTYKQENLLASAWLNWQKELERASGQCNGTSGEQKDKCLADQVGPVIQTRPRPTRLSDVTGLASDLMAGQLMLANENIRLVLASRLSVSAAFLGTGFAEPTGHTDFTAARVPEYLVPNITEKSAHVWTWQLDPATIEEQKTIIHHNLLDILHRHPPTNHKDFEENWNWLQQHLQLDDPQPVLVRFAFPDVRKKTLSGCLGRLGATRVFMSPLGELSQKTLGDAAASTGYTVPEKSDEPGLKFVIWLYAPTTQGAVVRATWDSILTNFSTWIADQACRTEN
jgi:hypothetical protein